MNLNEEIEQIRARHTALIEDIAYLEHANDQAALSYIPVKEHSDRARLLAIVDEMRREREPQVLLTGMREELNEVEPTP